MENDQFVPLLSPRRYQGNASSITLSVLPEDEEVGHSLTPSEFKDRLIFGSSIDPSPVQSPSPPSMLESLLLPSSDFHRNTFFSDSEPSQEQQQQQLWLVDPSFGWKKPNLHRSKTAPAMAAINEVSQENDPQPEQPTPQCMIKQAFLLLLIYLSFGVVIYWFNKHHFSVNETHPVVDALYFCIVTMCTIGYGDITPTSTTTKLFSILFVLVGFGFIDILLSGMVSYVLDLQENYILREVKAGIGKEADHANSVIVDVKKGRMRIRMKVALALGVVVLCIGLGVAVLHYIENLGWLDSFYLSVMSVTTVGYGDRAFESLLGRVFASIWLLVSTLAVARAFLYLAEARVDKRNRRLAKWVLGRDMTVSQFLAADIDNNGFVSKSEYVVYKLKEMGKVSEKDIVQIGKKFDELDSGNNGKITLADLLHSHD